MKKFEHIKHQRVNSKICSFYICNIFKTKADKIELIDILKSDLLNERYFQTKKQLKDKIENSKNYFRNEKNESKSIIINSYGPLIRNEITTKDFEKLNYQGYKSKIESIINNWGKTENELKDDLNTFHLQSLNELQEFNLENRNYYFLDSSLIEKQRKHEFDYSYSYFYTIIGIERKSNSLFILNYGND